MSDGELAALLTSPRADTELRGPAVIVTSPDDATLPSGALTPDALSPEALDRLATLPCVIVGSGHAPDSRPDHVDVVADEGVADATSILATIEANPLASVVLALLLRGAPSRSLGEGLAAESAAYSVLQAGPEFARWLSANRNRRHRGQPEGSGSPVEMERNGTTLTITLNRPHVRNALDRVMRDGLLDAFALARADDAITAIEVYGRGPAFCSGGDLDEFGTFDDPASAHLVRLTASIGRAIAAVADRTTFRVHGPCAGSGVELAGFAHRVVAAPDTTFALPEVRIGLVPGAGGTVSLTRRAGRHRVALLALGGHPIDAATARAWGLVDDVG